MCNLKGYSILCYIYIFFVCPIFSIKKAIQAFPFCAPVHSYCIVKEPMLYGLNK